MKKPFYGWIIVAVTFLIGVTESGAIQNIFSVFMKPMIAEFGWSRTSVTGSIAFGSICAGLLAPFVGPILDQHGPRMVAFWSILILSAGLVCMAFSNSIWQLYLFFGVGRMVAVGVLSMVVAVTVSNWFVRQRGRALGISWLGPRLGSVVLPALVQFIILHLGWRMAWAVLGMLVFLMSGIPALLFLKRRPEDIGLLPDGTPSAPEIKLHGKALTESHSASSSEITEPGWTRAQALRTRAFWGLTLLYCLIPFVQAGTNFHMFPFLTDRGLNEMTAVFVISTIAVFGALGSVVWGVFIEKFHIQRLLSVNVIASGLVFLLIYWAVEFKIVDILGTGNIFVLAAFHGILHGGRNPMMDNFWAVFFGRNSLGSIYSAAQPFRFTANAFGPLFAAYCFDIFGNYAFPFYIFVVIYLLSGIVSLFMKPPRLSSLSNV